MWIYDDVLWWIPTSLTVSAKPAERGDGVGDDIREFECWVVKEGDWVISGDVCCEIYALNCATEYKENNQESVWVPNSQQNLTIKCKSFTMVAL